MADSVGMFDVRGENIDKGVSGFALRKYVFKQLCTMMTSSSWTEKYYQETAADLVGGTGEDIEGVPRLAVFPYTEPTWTLETSTMIKHGDETRISIEDIQANEVDVVTRSIKRISRAVVKSVDTNIWNVVTENQTAVNINSLSITAGSEWDAADIAKRDPIQNILNAKKEIYTQDYNPDDNGFLILNEKDYANLLGNPNIRNAGQFYTDDVTRNGRVGHLLGLKVLVSNNVTADYAAIVIGKEACTWKTLEPLKTETIRDPGIGDTIRSWEIGVAQLREPKAVCLIDNTAA